MKQETITEVSACHYAEIYTAEDTYQTIVYCSECCQACYIEEIITD